MKGGGKEMKISKLIENLKYMKESYGDLKVILSYSKDKEITSDENIHFSYDQRPGMADECSIQNFPY